MVAHFSAVHRARCIIIVMPNKLHSNDLVRIERQKDVAALYLRGVPQMEIAAQVGISQPTVSRYLKDIFQMWKDSAIRDFDEARELELQKINNLEVEYWNAWERSKETRQIKTKERTQKLGGTFDKLSVKEEETTGDPRFLAGVMRCIAKRCELQGLDKNVQKLEVVTWQDRIIEHIINGDISKDDLIEEVGPEQANVLLQRAKRLK